MQSQSNIERQVMASVAVIYVARKLLSHTALEVYVFAASLFAIWKLVWVTRVLQNFSTAEHNGLNAVGNYLLVAVSHTNIAVQLTLLVGALAFISLLVDFVRSISFSRSLAF